MSLVLVVQHWQPYLLRSKFMVHTDHHSLKHLLEQQISTPAQHNTAAMEYKTIEV